MTNNSLASAFWRSWLADEGVNSFDSILSWVLDRNEHTPVSIERITLDQCSPWRYDPLVGRITNMTGSFFQIAGLKKLRKDLQTGAEEVVAEQPVLIQDEIGYLGIIAKEFDGVMHLLMQAKIEPGNVNKVQVSPTIQATRSNFMQLHGGRRPAYLDYFLHARDHHVVVDQIQSEQSARFLGKRNRNVMVLVGADEEVEVLPTHMWMTLGQVKRLMHYDNLVNMDTRTVLSCLPWSFWGEAPQDVTEALTDTGAAVAASFASQPDLDAYNHAYDLLNDYKMFDTTSTQVVSLDSLDEWEMLPGQISHKVGWPFRVIYCDIAIEGREVRRWNQPLFEAEGKAFFGLLGHVRDGKAEFLVKVHPEIGCFDRAEFGPTVQREAGIAAEPDTIEQLFLDMTGAGAGVSNDVVLSEEGGRFFCEQNRNVVAWLDELPSTLQPQNLPEGYLWLDLATLNLLVRANNVLNIQLRNLISLLDIRNR